MSCKSKTDTIVQKFKKVDSSLIKSNSSLDNTYSMLYQDIQNKKSVNTQLFLEAQTIVKVKDETIRIIEQLKQELTSADSSDLNTNVDISSELLVNSMESIALEDALLLLFSKCISAIPLSKHTEAKKIFLIANEIEMDKNWSEKYFYKTPVIAAKTILNKFRNDCLNLSVFALTEIDNKLKK